MFLGCVRDDGSSVVVTTAIPGSTVTVDLIGPDLKHHYGYIVRTEDGRITRRFLGPIAEEELTSVRVEEVNEGKFRVQWGTSEYAGFCVIDVDEKLIIEDSNGANPTDVPFDPPSRDSD